MHAVIKTGGKQYRVKAGDILSVEKLAGEKGEQIVLDEVLLISDDGDLQIGAPVLENARVACEVLDQYRGKKIIVYKFKRRKKYRRKQRHRQSYTRLRVLEIAGDGQLKGKSADNAPVSFEGSATAE